MTSSFYLPEQRRRGASPETLYSICSNNLPCGTKYQRRTSPRDRDHRKESGKAGVEKRATAMWQVFSRWEP